MNKRQEIDIKRGEYTRERRKKFLRLKHLRQYLSFQRSETSKEINLPVSPKVGEQKNVMNYSFLLSIKKGIKYPAIVLIGLLIAGFEIHYPEIAKMSVSLVLVTLYDVLKHRVGVRLP